MNDQSINGQGLRLVKQAEGEQVPLVQPWEVEGERELIEGSDNIEGLDALENIMQAMHEHNKICTNPECQKREIFDMLMGIRRNHIVPLLKENNIAFYKVLNALLGCYIMAKGDEPLFVRASIMGLSMSLEIINKLR